MDQRKPRPSRFGTESSEARLAALRERAPTLGSSRKLRIYAIFGSVLLFLTVAAFYFAMKIYRFAVEQREEDALIQVDQAPQITETEVEKALRRIEEEETQSEKTFEEELERLKSIDLLEEIESSDSP